MRVHPGRPEPGFARQVQRNARPDAAAHQVFHAAHQLVDVHRLRRQWLIAREHQQAMGQGGGPFGAAPRHVDVAFQFAHALLRNTQADQFQATRDAHQQVVEIVRQPARQLAHGFHLLALAQGVFGLPQGFGLRAFGLHPRRGFDDGVHHADHVPVLVAHRAVAEGEGGFFGLAEALEHQRIVFDEGGLARERAVGDGADHGPDLAPDIAERAAQRFGLGAQDGAEGVVVDSDEFAAPDQAARKAGRQHHADGHAQRRGPVSNRAERRGGPIVGCDPFAHLAAACKKRRLESLVLHSGVYGRMEA
ncbi:hypothetical protein D3C71_1364380 [compost metagenome]